MNKKIALALSAICLWSVGLHISPDLHRVDLLVVAAALYVTAELL